MTDILRAVLIAPRVAGSEPIPWDENELPGLYEIDGLELTAVVAQSATKANIIRALKEPKDIVIWAGHGDRDQLLVVGRREQPDVIDGSWLATQMCYGKPPKAAIIAACNSGLNSKGLRSISRSISRMGINSIGMLSEIKNGAASIYTIEFCCAFVARQDVMNAHEVAQRATGLTDMEQAQYIEFSAGYTGDGTRRIEDRMDSFDTRLQQVEQGVQFLVNRFSSNGNGPS